jgi:hypothetical protein
MHLGVARLCLDCHEVHEYDRCPGCTSEAFAFISRWVKVETAPLRPPTTRPDTASDAEKVDSYRQLLQPTPTTSRAHRWMRTGGLLVAAGYVARLGWHIANRQRPESEDQTQKQSGT